MHCIHTYSRCLFLIWFTQRCALDLTLLLHNLHFLLDFQRVSLTRKALEKHKQTKTRNIPLLGLSVVGDRRSPSSTSISRDNVVVDRDCDDRWSHRLDRTRHQAALFTESKMRYSKAYWMNVIDSKPARIVTVFNTGNWQSNPIGFEVCPRLILCTIGRTIHHSCAYDRHEELYGPDGCCTRRCRI